MVILVANGKVANDQKRDFGLKSFSLYYHHICWRVRVLYVSLLDYDFGYDEGDKCLSHDLWEIKHAKTIQYIELSIQSDRVAGIRHRAHLPPKSSPSHKQRIQLQKGPKQAQLSSSSGQVFFFGFAKHSEGGGFLSLLPTAGHEPILFLYLQREKWEGWW